MIALLKNVSTRGIIYVSKAKNCGFEAFY